MFILVRNTNIILNCFRIPFLIIVADQKQLCFYCEGENAEFVLVERIFQWNKLRREWSCCQEVWTRCI